MSATSLLATAPHVGARHRLAPPAAAPLRVLLLASSLERGGAERQIVELANALDPARFEVHVASLSTENPLACGLRLPPRRFHVLPKRRRYDLGLLRRCAGLLRRARIDVVHSFMFDAEMVGRLAGRLAGVPAVICSNRCPHWGRARRKLLLARLTGGCFDLMIANSWAGREFERRCQRVPATRLAVIPNGVDTRRFRPGRNEPLRRELGAGPDTKLVGMCAHFRGNKDHVTFIQAAGRVLTRRSDVQFVCIGRPDGGGPATCVGRARAAAQAAGLNGRLCFAGERADMAAVYQALDLKVLSSNYEGTPNVVLEAMASGLPVIATDVSDNARLIVDGRTGYVVPPHDPEALAHRMLTLLADDELRCALGAAARQRALAEYSVHTLAARTAAAYLGVLARKSRAAGQGGPS